MGEGTKGDDAETSLRSLREEVAAMRAEQRELARMVDELNRTFRALATQLGIVAEPYKKGSSSAHRQDLPGFG
ncbi:MAG: hypothetical protein L3K09_05075 [Thermoplasmata archaeon]|nr:hypothetical protein [Thermoplasmata archaeon]